MPGRKTKSRRKKTTKSSGRSQNALMMLTGAALTMCFLSITYGVLIRQSAAKHRVQEFRVEVLNGTGHKGLAARAASALRERGIDVFNVENADHFEYEQTILIGRKAGMDVKELARALGCDNVIDQRLEGSLVDATLILGSDYAGLDIGLEDDSGLPE